MLTQFEGYEDLREFDWEGYRDKYGDIGRLDRVLEAEGDSTDRYKVSKQADVLMLLFLLSRHELRELLGGLGYEVSDEQLARTVSYYLDRTSHGSTLSSVVSAWVLARYRPEEAAHGSALGVDEVAVAREVLGFDPGVDFRVEDQAFTRAPRRGAARACTPSGSNLLPRRSAPTPTPRALFDRLAARRLGQACTA